MLSDKGSRSIYVDRFWGQVLRKYLRGTQGRPELCFGGFSTYGEPHCPLSSTQPSGAIEETGPFFTFRLCGRRSRLQVSAFIRSLVKECHAKALERGATVHPVPTSLLLTQDLDTNAEVESERDDAPELEEHEYDSDEFF